MHRDSSSPEQRNFSRIVVTGSKETIRAGSTMPSNPHVAYERLTPTWSNRCHLTLMRPLQRVMLFPTTRKINTGDHRHRIFTLSALSACIEQHHHHIPTHPSESLPTPIPSHSASPARSRRPHPAQPSHSRHQFRTVSPRGVTKSSSSREWLLSPSRFDIQ